MTARPVTLREVFNETGELGSKHQGFLIAVLIAIIAAFSATDLVAANSHDQGGVAMLSSTIGFVINLFVQYLVIERLLADRRPAGQPAQVRRYGSIFGVQFISGLAIVVGLILFVLPGIYFASRWLTSSQRVVESQLPAMEALRSSWEDSAPSQLTFIVASLISMLPTAVFAAGVYFSDQLIRSDAQVLSSLILNGLSALGSIVGWVISSAAFRLAIPAVGTLEGVFD